MKAGAWFSTVSVALLAQAAPAAAAETSPPLIDLSAHMPAWMKHDVYGSAIWQYVAAFLFVLLALVIKVIVTHLLKKLSAPPAEGEKPRFNHLIISAAMKPLSWLILLGGLSGAVAVLSLPAEPDIGGTVYGILRVLLLSDFIWFLFRLVDVVVVYLSRLAARTESKLDDQLVPMLSKALKVTLLAVCFIWVLQLLGYNVSSLIAGLGIGGLAVALALQDTLSNFFGSIFVFLDKPFAPGDWIKVAGVEGVVEEIGFRSTRIRSWPATVISIPNKTVAGSIIDNWSTMPRRRVYQNIAVTYGSTPAQMEEAIKMIHDLIANDEDVASAATHLVRFNDFTESGLSIMLYYFTKSTGWDAHLASRERINLSVMRILEKLGMKLAVPARTVTLTAEDASSKADTEGRYFG